MRFTDTGPDIPDDLLFARDQGRVLFFCGAGVSRHFANLSDFPSLASKVMDDLGSPLGSPARRLLDAANTRTASGEKSYVPVDRMFSALDQEFDPQEVREAVARALEPDEQANLAAHRMLLALSKGSDGRPRLVTTNFDLLFEACDPQMASCGPPNLPLPERAADFEGVIHLHGLTNSTYTGMSEKGAVVLSSSDFGKAYLSDGWATQYIRRLMDRFKIVFVGYSADDPPVQYLLEALREDQSSTAKIYAFQEGDEASAREQWEQKGVAPISFGPKYSDLWETLAAWAERANDVDAWYENTFDHAAKGPENASRIFRGRMAHLASSQVGMQKLASSKPHLPSTWLYAFDPNIRYLNPMRSDWSDPNSDIVDPFLLFGIDRDQVPAPPDPDSYFNRRKVPGSAWSAFELTTSDLEGIGCEELGSLYQSSATSLRSWQLAIMLSHAMHETPALWWAAGQNVLHARVVHVLEQELRYRLRDKKTPISTYWQHLLNSWTNPKSNLNNLSYALEQRIKIEGWSPLLVREVVKLYRPSITVKRKPGVAPPLVLDVDPKKVIGLDVDYPNPNADLDIADEQLPFALSLWRDLLLEAEQMEREIDAYILLDTTRADDGEQLGRHGHGMTGAVVEFTHLVSRLEALNPIASAIEVESWSTIPGIVFQRLKIWAAGRPGLTSADYAESLFCTVTDEVFWSSQHKRDLMFSLRDRWSQLSEKGRAKIEARFLETSIPFLDNQDDIEKRSAWYRLDAIHWLSSNGVVFSFDIAAVKEGLQKLAPDWQQDSAEESVQPRFSGVHSIDTDNDPSSILDVPFNSLLPLEETKRKFREYTEQDPFSGYALARPAMAVLALHSAMRRQVPTAWFYWLKFLRATSEMETSTRLDSVVVTLVLSLPSEEIAKLWHYLVDWVGKRANKFETLGKGEFDLVLDAIVATARIHPSGYTQKQDRDWGSESLNSVIGKLAETIMFRTIPKGQKDVPPALIKRMEKLLGLPGDHADHALYFIARQTPWLFYHKPDWTEKWILSQAKTGGIHADAFWAGFARLTNPLTQSLTNRLKLAMLERVQHGGDDSRNIIAFLLNAWGADTADKSVTDNELRQTLISVPDDVRSATLRIVSDGAAQSPRWADLIIPFISNVWPKQKTVKTPAMASELFNFASKFPALFARIIEACGGRFVTLSRGHNLYFDGNIAELDAAGAEALIQVLEILLPEDRADWPYDGKGIINELEASGLGVGPSLDELARRAAEG